MYPDVGFIKTSFIYDRSQESMSGSVKNQPGTESGAGDGSEFYY